MDADLGSMTATTFGEAAKKIYPDVYKFWAMIKCDMIVTANDDAALGLGGSFFLCPS